MLHNYMNRRNKQPIVLYDFEAFLGEIGGVSRCFTENIKRLDRRIKVKLCVPFSDNIYLKEYKSNTISFLPFITHKRKLSVQILISKIITSFTFIFNRYDIIHTTGSNLCFMPIRKKRPIVVTIHDLIPEELGVKNNRRQKMIKNANHIIAVSEFTKHKLLHFYPFVDPKNVSIVYHGYVTKDKEYKKNIWGDYILYVGGRTNYKNFEGFLKAVAPLLEDSDLKLVCTGSRFSQNENRIIEDCKIDPNKIIQIFADERTLYSLYHYAKVFVYPSFMEGFGIPILEAWDNECPICISNASCFPEVAQDGAVYFNPSDIYDMRDKILTVINDNDLRLNLIKKGKANLKEYTWERSSNQIYDIYCNLKYTKKSIQKS